VNPISPIPTRVGIVGGGDLGSLMACRLASLGREVVVQEVDSIKAAASSRRIASRMAAMVKAGDFTAPTARDIERSIRITIEWTGFDNSDFVVEAAAEDGGVKRNVFHELEQRVRPRVILATASTTISVEAIQSEMSRPRRIAGWHFANPHESCPIAEIVGSPMTDAGTVAALSNWSRSWGFIPIRVADRPGRLVQLVQFAYLSEGVRLVAEGLPIEKIDAGCRQFGMARGPLEWSDEIGLDRLAERAAHLQIARDDRFARNLLFQRLLPFHCLGNATDAGFYRHGFTRRPNQLARMLLWQDLDDDGLAPYVLDPTQSIRDGVERVILRTVNEAAAALADEPDSDPAVVDMALTIGMGWAPHRGGPMRFADDLGLANVVDRLTYLAERHGPYLAPCDELVRRAEAGESFYGGATDERADQPEIWRMAG
jgi:3-hydroxyacyl-CoA dehydrogenase